MLTTKEQKKLARLEDDMKMPPWKYILIYGMIFGVLLAIITAATDLFQGITVTEILRKRIWVNLAMAPVAGVLFGAILRWLSIKQYFKLKAKERLP